ncbi:hypothetical protein EV356DRAFT_510193 [Viridothelium virens]|uniref:Glucose-methanol-choline oxidoreductase C-terminal domain-containing protein n=1 Tax=Viridothelium virens TaxID=1048519 RepID=A0A6A6GVX3_VIRVR|nr:hypothetical protein EV356DRAFT_510193 [Viridothelium virens]
MSATSFYRAAGMCIMGRVAASSLNAIGVYKLRKVDASVIPVLLLGHYPVLVLAIAGQAVEI